MAYIKVNVTSLVYYGDLLESVKKRSMQIRDQFITTVNSLDCDVKKGDGIYDTAKSIVNQLDAEYRSLYNMSTFVGKAGQVYGLMDQTAGGTQTAGSGGRVSVGSSQQQNTNGKQEIPEAENYWGSDMFSSILDILGAPFMQELGDKIVGLDFVSSIFGINNFIIDIVNTEVEYTNEIQDIQNDSSMTDSEKEYMTGVADFLKQTDAALDTLALGWSVFVPGLGGIVGGALSHLGDGINSDGVREELLEGYREIEDAKEKLANADTFWEKVGSAVEVGWEHVENAFEVSMELSKEIVEDFVNDAVEVIDNVLVQPVKKFFGFIGGLFS